MNSEENPPHGGYCSSHQSVIRTLIWWNVHCDKQQISVQTCIIFWYFDTVHVVIFTSHTCYERHEFLVNENGSTSGPPATYWMFDGRRVKNVIIAEGCAGVEVSGRRWHTFFFVHSWRNLSQWSWWWWWWRLWDDCDRVFPDELRVSSIPDRFPHYAWTAARSAHSDFVGSRVYACLGVTCHLHFWQNDRVLLRATVVTRG